MTAKQSNDLTNNLTNVKQNVKLTEEVFPCPINKSGSFENLRQHFCID